MTEFDILCRQMEMMPKASYQKSVIEKAERVLPALKDMFGNGEDASMLFLSFILGAVSADNRFNRAEFELLSPCLEICFNKKYTFEEAMELIRGLCSRKESMASADHIVDEIGKLSRELKEDIVALSLLICAADREVSEREKAYLRRLLA